MKVHPNQVMALDAAADLRVREKLRTALLIAAADEIEPLRVGYRSLRSEEEPPEGADVDRLELFIDDGMRAAEDLEIDAPADMAALLGLFLVAESTSRPRPPQASAVPGWTSDAADRDIDEFLDYARAALNRPQGSGAARMALIDAWLARRAAGAAALAAVEARILALREAVS
jgi:hypothetical protein